jgi:hypothetical protein
MVVNEILTMKKQYIAACLAGVASLGLGTAVNADVVFQNAASASTTGNQSGFTLGMDFNVACPMTVTSLGTFDNNLFSSSNPGGSGSIAGSLAQSYATSGETINIYVALYSLTTGLPVTPIADFTTAGALAGNYTANGSSIFESLTKLGVPGGAITLPVGNYAIEATGYFYETTGGFLSGNDKSPGGTGTPSAPAPLFDTLGNALTLGSATYSGPGGNAAITALPTSLITSPQNVDGTIPLEGPGGTPNYLAGTFEATCNCSAPDGGTTIALLGFALTGIAGLSRKFKK